MCTSCGDNNCNQCNVGYHVDYSLHSDNTSGGNSTSSVDWANILNKPVLFPPISQIHTFITDWDTAILALIPFSSISNTNSISLNLATSILSASLNLSMGSVGANFRVTNSIQPDGLLSTIPVAGTATSGALTYIDWNIFNNKQDALGFTPPPNTRTITLTSPTWSKTYDLSANRTWNNIGDILSSGSYSNPSWITALAWAKITGTPTTLAGYGITDGGIAVGHGLSLTTGPTVAIDETSLTSNYMPYWAGTKFANTNLGWNNTTRALTIGTVSAGLGAQTLPTDTYNQYSTAFGRNALVNNLSGGWNLAIGYNTLTANTTGSFNIAIGPSAGASVTTGSNNVIIGSSVEYTINTYNTIVGMAASGGNYGGGENTNIGYAAGTSLTTGGGNSFHGFYAGYQETTGEWNTFLGSYAGGDIVTGSNNTIIGSAKGSAALSNTIILSTGDTSGGSTNTPYTRALCDSNGWWGFGTSTPNSSNSFNGSMSYSYAFKNTNTVLDSTMYAVAANTAITFTLPTALGCAGRVYRVINTHDQTGGATNITVAAVGGQTIAGNNVTAASTYLVTKTLSIGLMSDGVSQWNII